MVPEGDAGQPSPNPAPPPAPPDPSEDPHEVAKLSKKDQQILVLRKQKLGLLKIGKEVKLSRTAVRNHVNSLIMRGFLSPENRVEDEEATAAAQEEGGSKVIINNTAIGKATAEAARQAADMAVETTDVFMKTGEWAWRVFNEEARAEGYADIFAWLGDLHQYWRIERQGWQPVLEELRASLQENDHLRAKVEFLLDMRDFRKDVLEAVLMSNLSGTPMTGEQLSVLVLGRAPTVYPAAAVRVLPPG